MFAFETRLHPFTFFLHIHYTFFSLDLAGRPTQPTLRCVSFRGTGFLFLKEGGGKERIYKIDEEGEGEAGEGGGVRGDVEA